MEKVLITGGAGYVGTSIIPILLKNSYKVKVYDSLMFGGDAILPFFRYPNFEFVKADIRDEPKLTDVFADQDAVIHLACVSNDPSFELAPELGKSINYVSGSQSAFLSIFNHISIVSIFYHAAIWIIQLITFFIGF